MKLVIVESPTKAKTIARFLGKGYTIESSFGHVRDLPKSKIGVDVEHNFEPQYIVPVKAKKHVTELKKKADKADTIYLATDEDREGEAIAWHLQTLLTEKKGKKTATTEVRRITFHEITKEAILNALEHPRDIALDLVDAQQARRILDRLVGYELSPFLWRKIYRGLSAGRVQSVALRLIVEREREIQAFKPQEYWTIDALLAKDAQEFNASLHSKDGKAFKKLDIGNKEMAEGIVNDLNGATYTIGSIEKKERSRKPLPPFTTSTLQQEGNNKLGYSAKQTMMIAQQLYEGIDIGTGSTGLITYMRTDSVNLAEKFLTEAETFITATYGANYAETKKFTTKSKGAQEAHEAIRPTDVTIVPESIKQYLDARQYKLYNLIWSRAVASQMKPAITLATTVDIAANAYTFRATGSQIQFDGWLKIYPEKVSENMLPELTQGDTTECKELKPNQHFTEPPARFTEAALVKAMEERGIGRPSTYAPTIATIQTRGYVRKEERKLIPEEVGFLVNDLLVEHFPNIVDYDFTAKMEADLDEIAEGKKEWQPLLKEFYDPFKKHLMEKDKEISKESLTQETTNEICPKCGKPMIIKMGRFGKFLACSAYPECKTTRPLGEDGKAAPEEVIDVKCDKCGKPMVKKRGRFGEFLGCSDYPTCKNIVNIEKKVGVTCPKCNAGDIIEKRSRYGKTFYACNQYPKCENAYWSKPNGETCPNCKSLLLYGAKNTIRCSNKECGFKKEQEEVAE
ncbi:MAG: type I DNA topoisomerase [Candidatus Kerfeldbacteria bacterium]|nr:type I DNA topoisomerase [Candidatus Kerfeldbacteria bacterium]